ncbi:MAG: M24 family metallopeptidase [Planctomycetota bacterium]|jgi:Xaa-Pro aminopeptidase
MKIAGTATGAAHIEAMKRCRVGMNEGDLQKIILETYRENGATGIAFPCIIGSGRNGTVLHYQRNNAELKDGVLIVIDIGAEFEGYAADVTRTIPANGKFTPEQKKAYECVLAAAKAAEKRLKAGTTWKDLDRAARAVFEKRKLTKWSYAHAKVFAVRHGLGHFVGLHVHDPSSYRAPLKAGMVITIEPGYYDRDAGFGIRIEDTYVVTKKGFERIAGDVPREIKDIEKLMAGEK